MSADKTYAPTDNLVDLWEASAAQFAGRELFGTKNEQGVYTYCTYREIDRRIHALRAGLAGLGVSKDDAVAFIANNSPDWAVAAFATYGRNARFVPLYEGDLPATWKYILGDCGAKVAIVATKAIAATLESFAGDLPSLVHIFVIEGDGDKSLAALERAGHGKPVPAIRPEPSDIAALIYTSGTTGNPKGVLLTHGNFVTNVHAGRSVFPNLNKDSRSLAILPWAHVYGQTAELYNFISFGGSMGLSEGPTKIAEELPLVRPTHLMAVPRIFNRVYEAIWLKMREAGGLKMKLFEAALAVAQRRRLTGHAGVRYMLLDRLVLSKIRDRFGGRMTLALTGSAKMNIEVAEFFFNVGIPIYDCFGMTETSPAVSMNTPTHCKLGTVGRPLQRIRVEIDHSCVDDGSADGEIIVYGPNVMKGYHNQPEATAAVITADGGMRTGDRGRLDEEGYLHITGRFKEQYKLENGLYVFPSAIEEELQRLPYVAVAMVHGESRPHNVCLIALDRPVLEVHAKSLGLYAGHKDLFTEKSELTKAIQEVINQALNSHLQGKFSGYEIPRRFFYTVDTFSVENGMLTQTLKLKRRAVLEKFGAKLDSMYE